MKETAECMARAFVAAINRQDVEGLAELMTEGHRFVDSLDNVMEGRETMRAAWAGYFRMVPDYTVDVEEVYCAARNLEAGPSTALRFAQNDSSFVVVMLGVARGTYAPDGELKAENRWETPVALRALIVDGLVAEWRVYADNEPIRRLMR